MARTFALFLTLIALSAFAACGGDDDTDSPTPATDDTAEASDGSSATEPQGTPDVGWTGSVSGGLTGEFTNKLDPQCFTTVEGWYSIVLEGTVNEAPTVVTFFSTGTGTFSVASPADEAPTVGVATGSEPPAEWFVVAGRGSPGELTIEEDHGSVSATLPLITSGSAEPLMLTADWTCPEE
jgi:hypothetical protein